MSEGLVLMACRTCGKNGDHWTAMCPYKDLSQPSETFVENTNALDAPAATGAGQKGMYVLPTKQAGYGTPLSAWFLYVSKMSNQYFENVALKINVKVATMFAVMLETDYMTKPVFKENFMNDWRKILGRNHTIQNLDDCDFRPIYEWHQREKEKKKQMSTEMQWRI